MKKKKYVSQGNLLNHPILTVVSYFVFQGMRYMTPGERFYKIALTLLIGACFLWIGVPLVIALLLGHGFNFLLNGQLPVLMRYVVADAGLTRRGVAKAFDKLIRTAPRFGIIDILVFGSFCRHQMKSTSDLDIRFYHGRGVKAALAAYVYATYVRLWANLNFIPIDVYCCSSPSFLDNMRADENPALLFFAEAMVKKYPKAQEAKATLNHNRGLE